MHRQQRAFIIAFVLLTLFLYIGYRSHSTGSITHFPEEHHRAEINKDKEQRQRQLVESNKIKAQKQIFFGRKNSFEKNIRIFLFLRSNK